MQPQLQPVDRLTSLPNELFEIICRDAQADPSCPDLGLVSKAFLHVARQRRFETLCLKSYRQLDELCGMTHLHGYIQRLELRLYGQVDYYGVPSRKRLERLIIQGLTGLRILDVRGCPRVAKAIVAPTSDAMLPNLTDLSFDRCFESRTDFPHPFNPQLYASIGTYGKLCRLSVTVHDATTSRQLPSARPEYKGPDPFPRRESQLGDHTSRSVRRVACRPRPRRILPDHPRVTSLYHFETGRLCVVRRFDLKS